MNRKIIVKKSLHDFDDGFVDLSPEECLSMMWQLTVDAWSFTENFDAEQRLQRHITNLIKK